MLVGGFRDPPGTLRRGRRASGLQRDRAGGAAQRERQTTRFRWAAPKFVRQSFHEFAAFSTRKSVWARAYYEQHRAKGKPHHRAVRAVAFKWIRILFRCWQDGTPYDEGHYLQALARRGSPLVACLPAAADVR